MGQRTGLGQLKVMGIRVAVPYHNIVCPIVFISTAHPAREAQNFEEATKYLHATAADAGQEGTMSASKTIEPANLVALCGTTLTLHSTHQGFR
jgi:hypothetical protein